MKVIPIIHRLMQLSTLKHSCFLVNSTLKRSWVYAETLLCSIYTYIYQYKKTCSWEQSTGDNFFLLSKSIFLFIGVSITLFGCTRPVFIPVQTQTSVHMNQKRITTKRPAEFYVCGNAQYPCASATAKWQKKSVSSKRVRKISIKKQKELQRAEKIENRSCFVK